MKVPQKSKNITTLQFSNPTSGYLAKGIGISILKRYLHPHVHWGITHKAKIWKQPKCLLTKEQIKGSMSTRTNFLCLLENLNETLSACPSTGMCI